MFRLFHNLVECVIPPNNLLNVQTEDNRQSELAFVPSSNQLNLLFYSKEDSDIDTKNYWKTLSVFAGVETIYERFPQLSRTAIPIVTSHTCRLGHDKKPCNYHLLPSDAQPMPIENSICQLTSRSPSA
jgi:hypothetical protein